ncbi:uncharacterized protein LOC128202006 [Galleria mellonella]|uniref:Uncharacterized protein LOC128202006 n=1 Tax=Galleria mellonella TaxID=7137 RepID=A0ABM3MZF4_GALME|nr:uncharacterized protein LOC128202006 [Galleria mellonella]
MEINIRYFVSFVCILNVISSVKMELCEILPLPRRFCCRPFQKTILTPNFDKQQIKDLIQLSADNLKSLRLQSEMDPLTTNKHLSPPIVDDNDSLISVEAQKALACSKIVCSRKDKIAPLCACNYNTGNVVTFKNVCDMQKHNCRFETDFKMILNEICPWKFEFRRKNGTNRQFDYNNPKYFN